MANEKGRKTTCLLFTAKQGKTDKVSNAHMLTISLTTSHLPSQCTGLLTNRGNRGTDRKTLLGSEKIYLFSTCKLLLWFTFCDIEIDESGKSSGLKLLTRTSKTPNSAIASQAGKSGA